MGCGGRGQRDEHESGVEPRKQSDPAELERYRRACEAAARATFAEFREEPGSDYYDAPGLTPEETWMRIRERVGIAASEAAVEALHAEKATPKLVQRWHRRVFETTFPETAGRLRSSRDPMHYGYVVGRREAPVVKTGRGTRARALPRRLRKICEELEAAAAEQEKRSERRLIDATLPAARFYAKLLSAHPFTDGNGRACYVALQFALIRMGALAVALPDHAEQQHHLGRALQPRGGQSYMPLAELLAEKIRAAGERGLQSKRL